MARIWKPLDLRRVRGQPKPGQLIAVRQKNKAPAYDFGRVKVINGRRSYYSVREVGSLMLNDESDMRGIEWMPLNEEGELWRESTRNTGM